MPLINKLQFPDYQLIDCGNFEKLERYGSWYFRRPESQAIWNKRFDDKKWNELTHAHFRRDKPKSSFRSAETGKGGWKFFKEIPDSWTISCPLPERNFKMKLSLSSFGHVGLFPEQVSNWIYIYQSIKDRNIKNPRVLNAFAYTGGSTLAARIAGAEVTHIDALKQVVSRGRENMELNKLTDIRWIVDDALKFIRREVKRGKSYHGIILDPPAFGRGTNNEKWILDESINELLSVCSEILEPTNSFFVISLYAYGYSPLIANNLVESHFPGITKEYGELYLSSESEINLPQGVFVRFRN